MAIFVRPLRFWVPTGLIHGRQMVTREETSFSNDVTHTGSFIIAIDRSHMVCNHKDDPVTQGRMQGGGGGGLQVYENAWGGHSRIRGVCVCVEGVLHSGRGGCSPLTMCVTMLVA